MREHAEAGVRVREYRPFEGGSGAALLWLHGGSLIIGAPRMDEDGARPATQLLVYPMLDDRTAARRELDEAGHLVWHNRSNRAGVAVTRWEVAGAPHGFDVLAPDVALATTFAARHHAFLRERLGVAGVGSSHGADGAYASCPGDGAASRCGREMSLLRQRHRR